MPYLVVTAQQVCSTEMVKRGCSICFSFSRPFFILPAVFMVRVEVRVKVSVIKQAILFCKLLVAANKAFMFIRSA